MATTLHPDAHHRVIPIAVVERAHPRARGALGRTDLLSWRDGLGRDRFPCHRIRDRNGTRKIGSGSGALCRADELVIAQLRKRGDRAFVVEVLFPEARCVDVDLLPGEGGRSERGRDFELERSNSF